MGVPARTDFLLDPDLVFLNNGSFGAVPRVVQEGYEALQREMERNPVAWLQRRAAELLAAARASVASYVGAEADDVVFFPNPTTAVNMVARTLQLSAGDEIVSTDHDYGAMFRTWTRLCREADASYVRVHIPLPLTTADDYIERVWSAVTPRTRVLFLDRLTSSTALILPVDELCRRARAAGIISIVDGAHVPGHIPLDVSAMGCDVFTGALHKWLCAPKGCSFLYARKEVQSWLNPLVTSWGWESDHPTSSQFIDYHEWQGTRDLSPFLAAPLAIDYCNHHDWPAVQAEGHRLALLTRTRINEFTGLDSIAPDDCIGQLASIRLPDHVDPVALKDRLFDEFRVEVPLPVWDGQPFIRVSFAAYNTEADSDAVVHALRLTLNSPPL
ncbi:MAG: aminotransferase class V-fold PLP-dependent enzyme [Actinomycetia bacterium]|nr:aminotransferase class V-fold PLP-dependent enzyme [Actinomycetes bacterium]